MTGADWSDAKRNESDSERQILYCTTYLWNLTNKSINKMKTKEQISLSKMYRTYTMSVLLYLKLEERTFIKYSHH